MMKQKLIGLMLLCTLCGISACKKDKGDELSLSAVGAWRPAESGIALKYVIIGEDGFEQLLESISLDLHTKSSYAYTATEEQIFLSGSYFNNGGYFKYKVSNDSLYLDAPGFSKVLLRETNAPAATDWVKDVTFTPQYPLAFLGNYGALEWNGTDFLIMSGYIPKRIYKYNITTQQVYDSVDITKRSYGFCYHNGNIWVNNFQNDNMLHTISFATGNYVLNSADLGAKPLIPASDGNKIWVFGSGNAKLYSYNPLTDVFTDEGALDGNLFDAASSSGFGLDMAIKDGYAYWALGAYIGKFSLSSRRFVETYQVTNGTVLGIAYDGTNFWGNGGSVITNLSIGKINLP